MPFAPHEIENKKFVLALRGYQTDEVDAFLRALAADYRALLRVKEASDGKPEQWVAELERVMGVTREEAEQRAAAIRAEAEHDAAAIRAQAVADAEALRAEAEREAGILREATQREAEQCYVEITRQAEELRRLEAALWQRMNALEHTVVEARHALTHVGNLYPMPPRNELAYGLEDSLGADTNAGVLIPAR
jgi:DivIVA domain-containing protein